LNKQIIYEMILGILLIFGVTYPFSCSIIN
jgi:hypothetical protein